ncbi:unnamed protein product [Parascedosporium putredinis]|uniref:Uncharacterized protein n=1 Tax=Parascedosporium putredinis TaxID=1442378 RepID=A0A9P1M771_9PEZI|nr:unnamed protein product [Parascedosporium putredinis]CAI7987388.1 unnamed protein product [Parascedosporium putredinis]
MPISSGFSFDIPTPGKLDLLSGGIFPQWYPSPSGPTLNGTFSSQNALAIPLTSEHTAAILWEFMQTHMFTRRSLDLKSREANPPRSCGHDPTQPRPIAISHLGIFSGLVDYLVQENTCPRPRYKRRPAQHRKNTDVQNACLAAFEVCLSDVHAPFETLSTLSPYDIAHNRSTQFPEPFAYGFLNREEIQQRLGVDIRGATASTIPLVILHFPALGELLDHGIPVTLAYGDRDYGANWFGGEALTKSIPFNASAPFLSAGYQDFLVQGAIAGKTRQAGLLSFTRIFQAGHAIPFYNPPATYALFRRAMSNTDIPRGLLPASAADASFSTSGPKSIRHLTQVAGPVRGSTFCYVLAPPLVLGQCSAEQLAGLQDGSALVVDFIVQ